MDERDEDLYDNMLEEMIDHDLVLISKINSLDLLLIASRELPRNQWSKFEM
ncbi:hypothetical protein BVRB_1g008420 [Beta vulgaris subsp. vulgaris]|nr:hypothetical protein BVRB_1g008420 [Beta vulgaris subsp. vulgaris]